ncbi:MAG: filamentous hemagglutinin N-terminal domain-containing protein, partial [Kiritimatiellae bacterium]|nr:filamentous hemagglutinin N-terminal domain-containing protein [Kiritimatiellia bacterium]
MKKSYSQSYGFSAMRFCRNKFLRKSLALWGAFATLFATPASLFGAGGMALSNAEIDRHSANVAWSTADGKFQATAGNGVGIIDWNKFNVGATETATFNAGTFFNAIKASGGASEILGKINGNANVWLFNPAGIFFGNGSVVNVGGVFAASTAQLENLDDLINGTSTTPTFGANGNGIISVDANVTIGAKEIALAAKQLQITAGAKFTGATDYDGEGANVALGKVVLGAGNTIVFDNVEGGSVSLNLDSLVADDANTLDLAGDFESAVEATAGKITVNGALTAKDAGSVNQDVTLTVKGTDEIGLAADVTAAKLTINGNAEQTAGSVILTDTLAADQLTQNGGTVKADTITANLKQTDGTITANAAEKLTIDGAVEQTQGEGKTATIGEETKGVEISKTLTQNAGTVKATTLTLNGTGNKLNGETTATAIAGGTDVAAGGTVKADTITANVKQTDGTITANAAEKLTIDGAVEQTQGEGKTATIGEATKDVEITKALTQNAGTVTAKNLNLNGATGANKLNGTVTVGETLTIAGTANAGGTVNAATIANTGLLTQDGGQIAANAVNGAFKQTDGAIQAQGETLAFGGAVEQTQGEGKTATIGADGKNVTVAGALTQNAGKINAATLTLKSGGEVSGTVNATDLVAKDGETVQTLTQNGGTVMVANQLAGNVTQKGAVGTMLTAATITGNVKQDTGNAGTITAAKIDGTVEQVAGTIQAKDNGDLEITKALTQNAGTINAKNLNLTGTDANTLNGTVDVAETLTAAGAVNAGGTVNAATIANTGLLTQDGGQITANAVNGAFKQTDGAIWAQGDTL